MITIPGIAICLGADVSISVSCQLADGQSGLRHEHFAGPGCCGIVSHHGTFYPSCVTVDSETGVGLVMDGWALPFERLSREQALSGWLRAYLAEGISFVERLNGAFNLAIWDPRAGTVNIATDRYGLRPICHGEYKGKHYLAPQARRILEFSGQQAKLNERAFYNLLSYSRVWAGEDTLYSGIRALPPATILTWRDGRISEHKYWDYVFAPVETCDDAFVEHVVETFKEAVGRHMRPWGRTGLNLSGGLDSRAIAAALGDDLRSRTTAFTWGYADHCQEVQLARQTAETCGLQWHFVHLTPEDFLKHARAGIRITEGRDLAVQSYGFKVFPEVAQHCSVSATGLAFDILAGGSYSSTLVNAGLKPTDDHAEHILNRFFYFRKYTGEMFLSQEKALLHMRDLEGQFRNDLLVDSGADPADLADRFALRQRSWRYLFSRQQWQRLYVEDVVPTFDNDLIDILLQLPAKDRANHHFFRRFLMQLDPKCMNIPYQRTLMPPSVPPQYWAEAMRIETEREDLFRRIYYETDGRVYVPYHRYYSNFDEWLRVNPTWRMMVDELLLAPNCRLSQMFIRPDWLRKLVDEQTSGLSAHYSRLVVLMTAELILRELFC